MTYDFNDLYQAYVTSTSEFFGIPGDQVTLSEFLDHVQSNIDSRLQDGYEPYAQDLWLEQYAQDNGLIKTDG